MAPCLLTSGESPAGWAVEEQESDGCWSDGCTSAVLLRWERGVRLKPCSAM